MPTRLARTDLCVENRARRTGIAVLRPDVTHGDAFQRLMRLLVSDLHNEGLRTVRHISGLVGVGSGSGGWRLWEQQLGDNDLRMRASSALHKVRTRYTWLV